MQNKLSARFAELAAEGSASIKYLRVDEGELLNWVLKARNLLLHACGDESPYLREFDRVEGWSASSGAERSNKLKMLLASFTAAQSDFDGGYIRTIRSLVQADVFQSEIDQGTELLNKGYKVAAAVIAGTVLETALRELCDRNQIAHSMIGKMNDDLLKKGAYNRLLHKRILAIAQVRNDAAHGNSDQFTDEDVVRMISDVEHFLANYLQ
jgi:hypothetical protein